MSIKERIGFDFEPSEDIIYVSGLDEAIIGFDQNTWSVVYSRSKVIDILMFNESLTPDQATQYATDNIFNSLSDYKSPIWVEDYSWL